ncbi:MAG: hypothetical protein WC584_01460 [Candidatus Pacearchaeota archaeon]
MNGLIKKFTMPLIFAASLSACASYNLRLASLNVDREDKRDFQIGWGCLGKGGNYSQIGILNLSLDNPWPTKLLPIYNSHTDKQETNPRATIQLGSLGYSEGACLQINYLNLRGNENPWYCKISPLIGWHRENKK